MEYRRSNWQRLTWFGVSGKLHAWNSPLHPNLLFGILCMGPSVIYSVFYMQILIVGSCGEKKCAYLHDLKRPHSCILVKPHSWYECPSFSIWIVSVTGHILIHWFIYLASIYYKPASYLPGNFLELNKIHKFPLLMKFTSVRADGRLTSN